MVMIDIDNLTIELIESKKAIKSNKHLITKALKSKAPIDDVLHVITVISNVCEFKRRWQLMEEFIERMNEYENIKLYVVELAYGDQEFKITKEDNPNHLQLRTQHALWHKENMINLGVKKLLPENWKAMAWIDGDIEFESVHWVDDTLKLLTEFDIIQLFTVCFDLDYDNTPMSMWQSFGYKYCNGEKFKHQKGTNYWHSGYAWACTREFYDKIGGLYETGIIGSGDYIMTQGFVGNVACADGSLLKYKEDIQNYINKNDDSIKIGYLPTNIKHHFHGSKKNRKYVERNQIIIQNKYDPLYHLTYDENGVIIPSENMSESFIAEIKEYFSERNEDEYYELFSKKFYQK
jgi:hypothetical protein